jgi:hypothetical protein
LGQRYFLAESRSRMLSATRRASRAAPCTMVDDGECWKCSPQRIKARLAGGDSATFSLQAQGEVVLAEGSPADALGHFRAAFYTW